MIKSKMRITPGSILPYFSALLILVSIAGYFLCWQATGSLFRFRTIADKEFEVLKLGEMLQVGGMFLLLILILMAAKELLWILALPMLIYLVGTVFLTLENSEAYYPLLIIGLIFFWFFVVTSMSIFHSKWPLCIVTILELLVVGYFCIAGKTPYLVKIDVPGEGLKDFYDFSFLMRVVGYYGGMLLLSLAIGKKYNMDTITATTGKVPSDEDKKKEMKTEPKTQKTAGAPQKPENDKKDNNATPVEDEEIIVKAEGPAPEPAIAVPVSGSRLQKVLKEDIVYDRDQRLMYKKKLNTFSVIGLILSVLTILIGVIIIFQLVDLPALKNDVLGIPMVAMGLFMCCLFGTRITYKEYYTQTVVTERKVMREETNWEEVLASRLEEDEQSIALLSENYTRMTEMYGKLLENTSELMKHVNLLGEYEQKLNLLEETIQGKATAQNIDAQDMSAEVSEETGFEEYVAEEPVAYEEPVSYVEPEAYEEPITYEEPAEYEEPVTYEEPVVYVEPELEVENFEYEDTTSVDDTQTQYFDLENQVTFDTSFLSEETIEKAFMDVEDSAEEVSEEEEDIPFILPTFRGYDDEPELPEEEPELPEMEQELPEEEPELPVMESELPEEEPELPVMEQELPEEEPELPMMEPEFIEEETEPELQAMNLEFPEEEPELPVENFELPEKEPEFPEMDFELPIREEDIPEEEPELPVETANPTEDEAVAVAATVVDADERRRKLQERLMEIQRRNREKINQLQQDFKDWIE